MKIAIRFAVSGTISRVKLYLDDERILLDDSGVGYSKPRDVGSTYILNYSGIGFVDNRLRIEMSHCQPRTVIAVMEETDRILLGQKQVRVLPCVKFE